MIKSNKRAVVYSIHFAVVEGRHILLFLGALKSIYKYGEGLIYMPREGDQSGLSPVTEESEEAASCLLCTHASRAEVALLLFFTTFTAVVW